MPNKIISRSVNAKKLGGSKPKQIQKNKQGVETAAKMREKIQKMQKDEEVVSDASDFVQEQEKKFKGAVTEDLVPNDPFFENENADEKRLRMTKKLIKELGEEQKNEEKEDFFAGL